MNLNDLFDFSSFEHKILFEKAKNLWEPLLGLGRYLNNRAKEEKGALLVGNNTKIDPTAKIEGSVIIGNNCRINEGALLREGVIIGDSCVIGHGCEVKHSIIIGDANLAHFNYVGDSVVGNHVNFAAGAITANYKHGARDEIVNISIGKKKVPTGLRRLGSLIGDGAKIGCNSVLDPGTIVGKRTIIYPLSAIRGTIPADKIVKYRQNFEVANRE